MKNSRWIWAILAICPLTSVNNQTNVITPKAEVAVTTDAWDGTTSQPQYERVLLDGVSYMPIFTAEEFAYLSTGGDALNENYILMSDLDFSGHSFPAIAVDSETPFKGILEGNGHQLSNVSFSNTSATSGRYGLFGVNEGTIRNLTLAKASMTLSGRNIELGAIAGHNTGEISRVSVIQSQIVSAAAKGMTTINPNRIGGLVGNNKGTIYASTFADSSVQASGFSLIISYNVYGGLIVGSNDGSLEGCYTNGTISGDYRKDGSNGTVLGTLRDLINALNNLLGQVAFREDGIIDRLSRMLAYDTVIGFSIVPICDCIAEAPNYYAAFEAYSEEIKSLFYSSGMYDRLMYMVSLYNLQNYEQVPAPNNLLVEVSETPVMALGIVVLTALLAFGMLIIIRRNAQAKPLKK